MSRRPGWAMTQVYVQHARWLEDQGPSYKHQAASVKRDKIVTILNQVYVLKTGLTERYKNESNNRINTNTAGNTSGGYSVPGPNQSQRHTDSTQS